jgi:peptidyl-prolyl cis-trans isomerase A (cyclophilin A)
MRSRFFHQVIYCIATIGAVVVLTTGCVAQGTATQTPALSEAVAAKTTTSQDHPALMDPSKATETAPEKFLAKFETTKGDFVIEVNRAWAPNGADRFYNMVRIGYFKDVAIFRAVKGFMFQFGIHGDPAVSKKWRDASITDDPSKGISNLPGYVSFAQTGLPNSRSAQMFVNLGNNAFLDESRNGGTPFVPFGKVVSGMDVVEKINTEYGENARDVQGNFQARGNEYIKEKFPNIDFIKSVKIVTE